MKKIKKLKNFSLRFFLIFMMVFSVFTQNVFCDDDDGDYSDSSEASESVSDSDDNDDSDDDDYFDDDYYSDYGYDVNDDVIWDGENFITEDDVYDDDGNSIYSSGNEIIDDYVYDHFSDGHDLGGSDAEELAHHLSDAIAALDEAKATGNDDAIAAAQAAVDAAEAALEAYCEQNNCTYEQSGVFVTVFDEDNKPVAHAGDPVIIATGKFVIDDSDISISNGNLQFSLDRHYVSNGTDFETRGNEGKDYLSKFSGALGPLWTTNLDTRIIRPVSSSYSEILKYLEDYSQNLSSAEAVISDYASEDSDCDSVLEEIRDVISANNAQIQDYEKKVAQSEKNKIFNRYADYGKSGSFNGNLPLDVLIFCGAGGEMILFEKSNSEDKADLNSDDYDAYDFSDDDWNGDVWVESENSDSNGDYSDDDWDGDVWEETEIFDSNDDFYDDGWDGDVWEEAEIFDSEPNSDEKNPETYLPASSFWKNKVSLEKFSQSESESETSGENQKEEFCLNFLSKNEKRFYSSYGLPLRFEYEDGNSILFRYDSNFRLSKVVLDENHFLNFAWNGNLLASVSDGARKITYSYSEQNLVSVTDFENDTRRFEYDDEGFLKKQIKADGSFISFEYEEIDGEKVISAVTSEEGKSEHFEYDFEARKTVYTNMDGEKTSYFYDGLNRVTRAEYCDGSVENWEFDESGNRISWNNGNVFASYKYDESGKLTEKTDKRGAEEKISYSGNHFTAHQNKYGITENYDYDEKGRITAAYLGGKLVKSFSYENGLLKSETDCRGNSVLYFYDEKSNLTEAKLLENGKSSPLLLSFFEYDSQNRVKKSVGIDGITRNFTYDDHKIVAECSNGVKITKIYSPRKMVLSEEAEDKITGDKIKREYEYDKSNRCKKIFVSGKTDGQNYNKTLIYEYDYSAAGKITREVKWNVSEKTQGSGTETLYSYDSSGNLSEIRKRKIKGGEISGSEKATRLVNQMTSDGNIVTEISGGAEKSFAFDFAGNLTEEKANGTVVASKNYSESGMLLSQKTGPWSGINYEYGSDGFLSSVSEKDSVKIKNNEAEYFADGKIRKCVDADGNETFYEYNGSGMLTSVSSPAKKTEYDYDLCGKLISKVVLDSQNRVIYEETWTYSDFGREVFHKIGGKLVEKLVKNGFGMLKSKSDSVENLWIYSHDILGRKTSEKNPYGKITKFTWNEGDKIEKIIFPDGSFKKFSYDLDLNLLKIEDDAGISDEYEYDGFGRVSSFWKRPSSAPEKYEYDDFGRVTKVTKNGKILLSNSYDDAKKQMKRTDACGNSSFWNFDGAENLLATTSRLGLESSNEWNSDGKIKSSIDFNGTKSYYSYGNYGLDKMISYSSGGFVSSSFDVSGNLLEAGNENSTLLFDYDSAGNLFHQEESGSGNEIDFESENGRITKISGNGIQIFYDYGKCGEVLKITEKSGIENSGQMMQIEFEYDSCGREISRKWSTGESMKIFYDGAGREILRSGFSSAKGLVFLEGCVYDKNGFKSLILDTNFSYKRYEYDGFGRVKSVSYAYSDESAEYLKSLLEEAGIYSLSGSEKYDYDSLKAEEFIALENVASLAGFPSGVSSGLKKSIKETFEYDLKSNLVKRTTPFGSISYVYDENDRLVSWGNGCSAKYDTNGNLVQLETPAKKVEMRYNAQNRLEKIDSYDFANDETVSAAYEYDALGRRTKSSVSGKGTTEIFYIGKTGMEFFSRFTPQVSNFSSSSSVTRTGKMTSFSKVRYKFRDSWSEEVSGEESDESVSKNSGGTEYFTSKTVPIFSLDGEILYLSSESDSSSGEQVSFMTGNTGTVKSSLNAEKFLSLLDYDEFGFPLGSASKNSSYGFIGKRFDSKTGFYDFGCRDYAPSFGRFSTEDPVLDGRNWYAYCAGDYVNFFDPDGLTQVVPEEQYMQSMEGELLGNSPSEKASGQGCVVTVVAETMSALTGSKVDPSFVNNDKSNFVGYDGTEKVEYWGNIDWDSLRENYGLAHTIVDVNELKGIADKDSGFYGLTTSNAMAVVNNADSDKAMAVANYIAGIIESSKETVVAVQVYAGQDRYGNDINHFVTVNGNVTMVDGKSYVSVVPTSISDKSVSVGTARGNAGWISIDGKIYAPVDNILRVDSFSKAN